MTKEVINIGDIVKYEGYPNNLYKVTRIKPNGDVILDCIKGAYHCIPYANVEKISLVEVKDVDLMKEIADIYTYMCAFKHTYRYRHA